MGKNRKIFCTRKEGRRRKNLSLLLSLCLLSRISIGEIVMNMSSVNDAKRCSSSFSSRCSSSSMSSMSRSAQHQQQFRSRHHRKNRPLKVIRTTISNQIVPSGKPDQNGIVPCLGPGMCEWPDAWQYLVKTKRMPTIDARKAMQMQKKGALIVDVRFQPDFEQWSIPGSINVPYIEGGLLAKLRLPGFKKKNMNFVNDMQRVAELKQDIILVDIWGGTLLSEPPKNRGLTDNTKGAGSLPAAFEMYQVGYTKLYHLAGGVNQYYEDAYKYPNELPEPDSKWPGDLEWFGYRQFNGKDRAKGQRDD